MSKDEKGASAGQGPDPRSDEEAYAGVVLTAAAHARQVAATLKGEQRVGAEKVAISIEKWVQSVRDRNRSTGSEG